MSILYQLYNIKEPPIIPLNISKELKNFLESCLKINPKERLNAAALLKHPFITGFVDIEINSAIDIKVFNSNKNDKKYIIIIYFYFKQTTKRYFQI